MRTLVAATIALSFYSTLALAGSVTSCRTEAALAADEWASGTMMPASEAELVEPAPLVVIAAGRKYGVVRNTIDPQTLRPALLGDLARQRNQVYHEELDRCLGRITVKIVGASSLTLKRIVKNHAGQN